MIKRMWIIAHVDVEVDEVGVENQISPPFVLCRTLDENVAERALGHFISADDGSKTIVRSTLQILPTALQEVVNEESSLLDDVISETIGRAK